MKYLVSACLIGQAVRYDTGHCKVNALQQLVVQNKAVVICPEMAGGLNTPRAAAEIVGGDGLAVLRGLAKVIDKNGVDVSAAFIQGAYQALALAQKHQITYAVLKTDSPSCGSDLIYDGSFSGKKVAGAGVTAALLIRYGFQVISEDTFLKQLT